MGDVINTTNALSFVYPEMVVLLGPTAGTPPGTTETFEDVYCSRVVQSAGGSRLDYAELTWALTESLVDRVQPSNFARMVAVQLPDSDETEIHLGDYVTESFRVDREAESLSAQSQMRAYHYGLPVKGYDVYNVLDSADATIDADVTFNPTIDDQTRPNMSSRTRVTMAGRLWTHADIPATAISQAYQDQVASDWTLRRAVEAICELLNPDEEFIDNPTYAELSIITASAPELRDVVCPIGTMLPQCLDILLIPHGFNWYTKYDTTTGKPKITVFKIGSSSSAPKELLMQAPGESLDLEVSNVNQFAVDNSIGDSFNQVRCLGDFEEIEVTIPLWPAWDETHDALSFEDLDKSGTEYAGKETVGRLWIANEAGDIDPATSRFGELCKPLDLGTLPGVKWLPHRRVLGEPLTYQGGLDSEQRRPIMLEYSIDTLDRYDVAKVWAPALEGWSVKLCPDQIGILFDGDTPPEEIVTAYAAENCMLRITGTVRMDNRLEGLAERESWAVNGRIVEVVINRPDKFQKRSRCTATSFGNGHEYRSMFDIAAETTENGADERDDTDAILTYAEALRDQNHYAELTCEFRLPGWHIEYEIGDLISRIAGREISFDAAPNSAPEVRYVQVTERRFENGPGGPSTVLIVDRGIAEVIADSGNGTSAAFVNPVFQESQLRQQTVPAAPEGFTGSLTDPIGGVLQSTLTTRGGA